VESLVVKNRKAHMESDPQKCLTWGIVFEHPRFPSHTPYLGRLKGLPRSVWRFAVTVRAGCEQYPSAGPEKRVDSAQEVCQDESCTSSAGNPNRLLTSGQKRKETWVPMTFKGFQMVCKGHAEWGTTA